MLAVVERAVTLSVDKAVATYAGEVTGRLDYSKQNFQRVQVQCTCLICHYRNTITT